MLQAVVCVELFIHVCLISHDQFGMVVRMLKNPKPDKVKDRVERQRGWDMIGIRFTAFIPPMVKAA